MAFDCFCSIDGIPGESTDAAHTDWIELLSFDHNLVQPITGSRSSGGAGSAERAEHRPFTIVKELDKASPKLALACCNGSSIPKIEIELCRATGDKTCYMKYIMEDVSVHSVTPVGNTKGESVLPTESVALDYGKIEWTYTETDHKTGAAKGDVATHWDRVENTGG